MTMPPNRPSIRPAATASGKAENEPSPTKLFAPDKIAHNAQAVDYWCVPCQDVAPGGSPVVTCLHIYQLLCRLSLCRNDLRAQAYVDVLRVLVRAVGRSCPS